MRKLRELLRLPRRVLLAQLFNSIAPAAALIRGESDDGPLRTSLAYKAHRRCLQFFQTNTGPSMTQSTSESKSKSRSPQKKRTHPKSTELFIINSSPQKGNGPNPRALRRRDEKYMLPRSPESPSPSPHKKSGSRAGSKPRPPPGSVHPRTKDCFVSVDGAF